MPNFDLKIIKLTRLSFVVLLFASLALSSLIALYAQRTRESSVKLVSILTHPIRNGTAVTLSADTPLTRTQTWEDDEGFHIVLLDAGQSSVKNVPRGVKVIRLSGVLEVLVQTRPHADVKVEPLFNRLTVLVSGGLDTSRRETSNQASIQEPCKRQPDRSSFNELFPCDELERHRARSNAPVKLPSLYQPEQTTTIEPSTVSGAPAAPDTGRTTRQTDTSTTNSIANHSSLAETSSGEVSRRNGTLSAPVRASSPEPTIPGDVPTIAYDDDSDLPQSKVQIKKEDNVGFLAAIISPVGAVALLCPGALLLIFLRQRRGAQTQSVEVKKEGTPPETEHAKTDIKFNLSSQGARQRSDHQPGKLAKGSTASTWEMSALELTLDGPQPAKSSAPPALPVAPFGEDRIEQEVSNLVLGLPYCPNVLSSRATDDRRVIEASLVKAMQAPGLNEDERGRARRALEERGFVLRRGAILLSAPNASERALAARSLAEMSLPSSMPFLLEALYDPEAPVRTEAITGIGVLKMPSAIGALLDVSLRHPETPISLLSEVLSSCSFEGADGFNTSNEWLSIPEVSYPAVASNIKQITPAPNIEDLPETLDDENLAGALTQIEDEDETVRTTAARALGQFRVLSSVRALTSMALNDPAAGVRAAAVTSLGNHNHASVFAPLLIAFADEARDVQAAAARALSRLNIDRAEAYVQLMETADEKMLRDVARACIKTGMVSQAVDRLTSPDRHQAYEGFSLLSLLTKSNETEAILKALDRCRDSNARSTAMGLFGLSNSSGADS